MDIFIDGYMDRSFNREIFVDDSIIGTNDEFSLTHADGTRLVCFDVRKLFNMCFAPGSIIYDLKMLYECDGDISRLIKSIDDIDKGDYMEIERRFSAHTRALSESQVDVDSISLKHCIPDDVRITYMHARQTMMKVLWSRLSAEQISEYETNVWPLFKDLLVVENAKIKIDEEYVKAQLKRNDVIVHEKKFLQSIQGLTHDGYVRTRINPVGSKTKRLRVDGGFNCMGIPHGVPRKALVSRFENGRIAVFDFNAIDYRCIVAATNDKGLNEFYMGQRDFHSRTASVLGDVTPDLRTNVKKIAYTHIYGGSKETLQKQTALPSDVLRTYVAKLDELFEPITAFRKKISDQARIDGFIITPGGNKVMIEKGDHDGKIIGLFAQTYSSAMFNKALHAVIERLESMNAKSRVIFTVHDELVIDRHPSETLLEDIQIQMQNVTGFIVKAKEALNYGDATD